MRVLLKHFAKTVAAAGTQERITTSGKQASKIWVTALGANTNPVFVGNADVSSTNFLAYLTAGQSVTLSCADFGLAQATFSLSDIWLDVTTNGEGASIGYWERAEGE
jgi:hypothetical protein